MSTTPVGMRCPDCARERTRVTNPVGAAGRSDAPASYALIALCLLSFLAQLATGGELLNGGGRWAAEGSLFGPLVVEGEPYRLLTSGFLHAGIIHLGLNMFVLYLIGSILEPGIGTARFVAIYFVGLLGGSLGALLLDPLQPTVGASGAVFGIMAAGFVVARQRGLDQLASQIGLIVVLNLALSFRPGISLGGHVGGLVAGGLAALLITALERRRVANARTIEILGIVLLGLAAAAGALFAADAGVPDGFR